jgi:hypothetical protein
MKSLRYKIYSIPTWKMPRPEFKVNNNPLDISYLISFRLRSSITIGISQNIRTK